MKTENDRDSLLFGLFYSILGAVIFTGLSDFSPTVTAWLKSSSWSALVGFVNRRYEAAAVLEPFDYSLFLLIFVLMLAAVIWLELVSRLTALDRNGREVSARTDQPEPTLHQKIIVRCLIYLIFPIFLLYGFSQLLGQTITLNAITDFKQHMRIIAPYVGSKERDELPSKWSQMRNLDDYNAIYRRLDEVANINHLRLPRNHTY